MHAALGRQKHERKDGKMGIRVEVGKQRGAHPRRTKTEDGAHRGDDGGTSATAQHATERTRRTKGWADQEQCAKPGPATRSSGGEPGRSVISGGSPGRKSPRKKSPPTRFYRSLLGIIRRVDPPIRPHPTTGGRTGSALSPTAASKKRKAFEPPSKRTSPSFKGGVRRRRCRRPAVQRRCRRNRVTDVPRWQ